MPALVGELSGLELAAFQLAWFRLEFLSALRTIRHESKVPMFHGIGEQKRLLAVFGGTAASSPEGERK